MQLMNHFLIVKCMTTMTIVITKIKNPSPSKKARVITADVSLHKFEKAWRDWTKQKDSTKSTDYNWKNFLGKGKKRAMNEIVTYYHFNHDSQKSLKRWIKRKNQGIISMRELNKIIYEEFLDHRNNNRIVTDRMFRLWAMKQRNLLGNEIAEKFVAWKRGYITSSEDSAKCHVVLYIK